MRRFGFHLTDFSRSWQKRNHHKNNIFWLLNFHHSGSFQKKNILIFSNRASDFNNNYISFGNFACFFNTSGELITGCQFRSGATEAIYLSACIGYVFQNCQFNYLTITNVNSYPGDNYFLDNTLDSAWSTVNLSTDGHLIHFHNRRFYNGNDSDNDATFGTFSSQNWTNLTGMPVAVNMASATSVAVFNLFGSNLVSAAVSPSYFILQPRGYTTNATGTGSYYGAP